LIMVSCVYGKILEVVRAYDGDRCIYLFVFPA